MGNRYLHHMRAIATLTLGLLLTGCVAVTPPSRTYDHDTAVMVFAGVIARYDGEGGAQQSDPKVYAAAQSFADVVDHCDEPGYADTFQGQPARDIWHDGCAKLNE